MRAGISSDRMTRTQASIERAGEHGRSVVDFCRAVHDAVGSLVPADRWCAFAVDPATLFATNGYHDQGIPFEYFPRLLEIEHGTPDCNQLPTLARSKKGVSTMDEATKGDPSTSTRWREILEPAGLPHELRAALRESHRDGGRTWGALILFRGAESSPFTSDETAMVADLAPGMATGLRRVLVRQHLDHADDAREAGILVVEGDPPAIRTATDAARAWLDQLDDGGWAGALPTAVVSAVLTCRSGTERPATVRARTRSGRWVTITAEPLHDGSDDHAIGIVLQPSRPAEIAAIVGAAHGLTPRESDVVVLVAAGRTNSQIARLLSVSPHTVGDHLKSIFTKLDVASRGEMTSKLYHDHYLPRELGSLRVGSDGWFLPG